MQWRNSIENLCRRSLIFVSRARSVDARSAADVPQSVATHFEIDDQPGLILHLRAAVDGARVHGAVRLSDLPGAGRGAAVGSGGNRQPESGAARA